MLQLQERGRELLARTMQEPEIQQALTAVINGFAPRDVCEMFHLPWDESQAVPEGPASPDEEGINVWECQTNRCRQKGKVATATNPPQCPSCGNNMNFLMVIQDPGEISHMARTDMGGSRIADPFGRTDKTHLPDHVAGGGYDED
jgi:hypothetical protein